MKNSINILEKKKYIPFVLINILSFFISIFVVYLFGYLIDNIIIGKQYNHINKWFVVIFLSAVVSQFLNFYFEKYNIYMLCIKQELKASVFSLFSLLNMPMKKYQNKDKSYYYNVVLNSTFTYAELHVQIYLEMISNIIIVLSLIIFVFFYIKELFIMFFLFIPIVILSGFLQTKKLSNLQSTVAKKTDEFVYDVKTTIEHKREINIYKKNNFFIDRFKQTIKAWEKHSTKFHFYNLLVNSFPAILSKVYTIIFLFFGVKYVINNIVTVGDLLIVYQYLDYIAIPVSRICEILIRVKSNKEHIERVKDLWQETKDEKYELLKNGTDTLISSDYFEIYRDDKKENLLYSGENIQIKNNKFIIIKGENGTGKSLLLNLISGNLNSDFIVGDINISKDINNLSYLTYPHLFIKGSFNENLFDIDINNELIKILNIDFTDREIKTNPINLSLGQQQKLSLLRVLSSESKYIFLDEPFSNLDTNTQNNIINYLNNLKSKKTIVVIIHDSLLDNIADYIYLIDDRKLKIIK